MQMAKTFVTSRACSRLKRRLFLATTAAAILSGGIRDVSAQGFGPCVNPSSTDATDLKHRVELLVSLSDSISANQRTRLSLPSLAANQVTIVSDTTVCRAASLAYDAAVAHRTIDKPVVVLALGTQRLVVKDYPFGEWLLAVLFNQTFTTMIKRFGL